MTPFFQWAAHGFGAVMAVGAVALAGCSSEGNGWGSGDGSEAGTPYGGALANGAGFSAGGVGGYAASDGSSMATTLFGADSGAACAASAPRAGCPCTQPGQAVACGDGGTQQCVQSEEFTTWSACDCKPATCAMLGANCGTPSDGCGGTLTCGTCNVPQTCGGAGTPNQCGGCTTDCIPGTVVWCAGTYGFCYSGDQYDQQATEVCQADGTWGSCVEGGSSPGNCADGTAVGEGWSGNCTGYLCNPAIATP